MSEFLLVVVGVLLTGWLAGLAALASGRFVPAGRVADERTLRVAAETASATLERTVAEYGKLFDKQERQLERDADRQQITNSVITAFKDYIQKPGG